MATRPPAAGAETPLSGAFRLPRLARVVAAGGWTLARVVDALRWLVLAVLLVLGRLGQPDTAWVSHSGVIIALLALYHIGMALSRPYLERRLAPVWRFPLDAAVLSLAILISGGLQSSLYVLYYLIVVGSALHLSTLENLAFTLLLAIAYTGAAVAAAAYLLDTGDVQRLAVRVTLLLIVATVSSVLTRQLREERRARERERELVVQLSALNEQLQEMERLKSDFLSSVSHDFKTPLTSIKASVGLLLEAAGEDNPTQVRLCRNIARNVDRLDALVSDLLDMARLQSGRMLLDQQPVQLGEVLESAIAMVRPLFEGREQRPVVSVAPNLPRIAGDRRRLEQVVVNLLSNANTYAPRRTQVHIEACVVGADVRVSITDRGPGVAPAERDHIFDRFYRSDDPVVRRRVGTGLGLAIARSLVERHGGRIWVVDAPGGRGSTFHFTLPIPSEPPQRADDEVELGPERDGAAIGGRAAARRIRHPAVRLD